MRRLSVGQNSPRILFPNKVSLLNLDSNLNFKVSAAAARGCDSMMTARDGDLMSGHLAAGHELMGVDEHRIAGIRQRDNRAHTSIANCGINSGVLLLRCLIRILFGMTAPPCL